MSPAQSFYESHSFFERLTLRWVRERIGHCVRERYQVPKNLPPELLKLMGRLHAIEDPDREQMLEAQIVGGVKAFPDWFVRT